MQTSSGLQCCKHKATYSIATLLHRMEGGPTPSNPSAVMDRLCLAPAGSYPWDRNHTALHLFHITASLLPYSSGVALLSHPLGKSLFLQRLLKHSHAGWSWCPATTWYFQEFFCIDHCQCLGTELSRALIGTGAKRKSVAYP